jgi:hypothetical protein
LRKSQKKWFHFFQSSLLGLLPFGKNVELGTCFTTDNSKMGVKGAAQHSESCFDMGLANETLPFKLRKDFCCREYPGAVA